MASRPKGCKVKLAQFQRRGPIFLRLRRRGEASWTRPGLPPTPWQSLLFLHHRTALSSLLSTHPFTTKKGSSMDMTPGARRRAGLARSCPPRRAESFQGLQPPPPRSPLPTGWSGGGDNGGSSSSSYASLCSLCSPLSTGSSALGPFRSPFHVSRESDTPYWSRRTSTSPHVTR